MGKDDVLEKIGKIPVLEERIDNWMKTTIDYRKELCSKIQEVKDIQEKIFDKLEKLPCDKRGGWYQSMSKQVKIQWGLLMAVMTAFIYEWVKKR